MRDPKRIHRIIKKLEAYWQAAPDMRLTQIIENASNQYNHDENHCIFSIEDERTEAGLDRLIKELVA